MLLTSSIFVSRINTNQYLSPLTSISSHSFAICRPRVHTPPSPPSFLPLSLPKTKRGERRNNKLVVRVFEDEDAPEVETRASSEDDQENWDGKEEEFMHSSAYRGRQDEKDYDRDPELAEILGSCFDDPQKAQQRVEDRIKRKKNRILHDKTGSETPVKVTFNKFSFSGSYIWFEFYSSPSPNDITLICDAIRSWHIIGRLGGCNSMNMQLSQAPLNSKLPVYDAIQGANVTPTTFYNIGNFENQDNLGRIWVDIGTSEPLLLDVLVNALFNISSDYVGIKQLVFGGTEFNDWKENLSEARGSVHKI